MALNIREIVRTAYAWEQTSPGLMPSAAEILAIQDHVRQATSIKLELREIEILLMAEEILDRHAFRRPLDS
jgi:hypothetical protein